MIEETQTTQDLYSIETQDSWTSEHNAYQNPRTTYQLWIQQEPDAETIFRKIPSFVAQVENSDEKTVKKYKRFAKGLEQLKLTLEDLQEWKYIGGNMNNTSGYNDDFECKTFNYYTYNEYLKQYDCSVLPLGRRYRSYLSTFFRIIPIDFAYCVCGQHLKYQTYIMGPLPDNKGFGVLVVGSCCIERCMGLETDIKKKCDACCKTMRANTKTSTCNACILQLKTGNKILLEEYNKLRNDIILQQQNEFNNILQTHQQQWRIIINPHDCHHCKAKNTVKAIKHACNDCKNTAQYYKFVGHLNTKFILYCRDCGIHKDNVYPRCYKCQQKQPKARK